MQTMLLSVHAGHEPPLILLGHKTTLTAQHIADALLVQCILRILLGIGRIINVQYFINVGF